MSSPVLYRKWRPGTLGEVVGQDHVTRTLLNALSSGRVSHAYLFCGPRGTGKTSTARILAKAVNCLQNGRGDPCGECSMCRAIAEGHALDLIEIDAASNRGIDDIRTLRDKINFAPNEARYKVYVVDEVHMLTQEAFNALLKTLEEPPPFAIFVLATTEAHRVPATIISRCQRFDFRRIPQRALAQHLAHICEEEGIEYDEEALDLIARAANGGGRDAVNLLEQVEVSYDREVRTDAVRRLLGLLGDARSLDLVRAIVEGDLGAGLSLVQELVADGVPLPQFGKEVTGHLRSLILLKTRNGQLLDVTGEELERLQAMAEAASQERLVKALREFSSLDFHGEASSSMPLELALLDSVLVQSSPAPAAAADQAAAAGPAARPTTPRGAPRLTAPPPPPPPVRIVPSRPAAEQAPDEPAGPQAPSPEPPAPAPIRPAVAAVEQPAVSETGASSAAPAAAKEALSLDQMRELIRSISLPRNKTFEAVLKSDGCVLQSLDGGTITLGFKESFRIHKERMEKPENLRMIEAAIQERAGSPFRLRCVVLDGTAASPQPVRSGHLVDAALKAGGRRIVPD